MQNIKYGYDYQIPPIEEKKSVIHKHMSNFNQFRYL